MKRLSLGLSTVMVFCPIVLQTAMASRADPERRILWGINDSGLEFGHGMKASTNYAVPDPSYYLQHGVQLVRVPFQIARLAPEPGAALNPVVLQEISGIVDKDRAAGAVTVLDPHGFGYMDKDGRPRDILTDAQARSDYVDLMRRLAQTFRGNDIAIGLMNEPHSGADQAYIPIWNEAISVIRQTGFHGTILVPHAHWSAASDISPAAPFPNQILDPERNWVLELHTYLDPDGTGTYRQPVSSVDAGVSRLEGAIAWSRHSGIRLFLGETGGPSSPVGLAALDAMLAQVASSPDVFWGVALWGGGPWWKPNYPMRLDPLDGEMRPQMVALQHQMAPEQIYLAKDPDASDIIVTILLDGRIVASDVHVGKSRLQAPEQLSVEGELPYGRHLVQIRLQPRQTATQDVLYLLGSTWKGQSDSADAFGQSKKGILVFHVLIPR